MLSISPASDTVKRQFLKCMRGHTSDGLQVLFSSVAAGRCALLAMARSLFLWGCFRKPLYIQVSQRGLLMSFFQVRHWNIFGFFLGCVSVCSHPVMSGKTGFGVKCMWWNSCLMSILRRKPNTVSHQVMDVYVWANDGMAGCWGDGMDGVRGGEVLLRLVAVVTTSTAGTRYCKSFITVWWIIKQII